MAKGAPKLTKSQSDPDGLPGLFFGPGAPGVAFRVTNAPLAEAVATLQGSIMDKPVVDHSGLGEKYDFILKFTPDPVMMAGFGGPPSAAATNNVDAPPDIFGAFEQQLRLKLTSTKAQADVLVIDRVENPSAN